MGKHFILFLACLGVGVSFITISSRGYLAVETYRRFTVETTAVISDIYVDFRSGGHGFSHRIYSVVYIVDSQEYVGQIRRTSRQRRMTVGQEITIFYNPRNPQDFHLSSTRSLNLFGLIFGIVIFLIGVGCLIIDFRNKKLANDLVNNGKRILATFIEFRQGYARVNQRSCVNLICAFYDKETEDLYMFESDEIWEFPFIDPEDQLNPRVPVYVDRDDYSKYYVGDYEFFDIIDLQRNFKSRYYWCSSRNCAIRQY